LLFIPAICKPPIYVACKTLCPKNFHYIIVTDQERRDREKMHKTNHTKTTILRALLKHSGSIVSSAVLSSLSRTTRQSVWKTIENLRSEGFKIDSIPHKGYTLSELPPDVSVSYIAASINDRCPWGENIIYHDSIYSTQTEAKQLAKKGIGAGATVIAGKQLSGRGRKNRTWISPDNGIYMSIITRPRIEPSRIQILNLVTAMAVVNAIKSVTGIKCDLKWPNDILYKEAKLCGILSEASMETDMVHYVVTGIGINVNTERIYLSNELHRNIVTLKEITGKYINSSKLIAEILTYFSSILSIFEQKGSEEIIESYSHECSTIGRSVSILTENETYSGTATGITSKGELILENAEGNTQTFSVGDVIHAPLQ